MTERERICLFAGTTEGRRLARILAPAAETTVCVATEYGEILLDGIAGIEVHKGRMNEDEMADFFAGRSFTRVIDATHPYAALVTENILAAAGKAGIPVLRVLREADREIPNAVYVNSVEEARDHLAGREGNIFLTTGSKELASYIGLDMERVWARVLPTANALESCAAAGIPSSHIIAAQGPFSEEINLAEMKSIGAKFMVTKASGKVGGFDEKIAAAKKAGVVPVIIGRPPEIEGMTLAGALKELGKTLPLKKTEVKIVGIGPGAEDLMTARAKEAEIPAWISFTVVPYDLRHSFCTMCRDNGVELNTCVRWMGHADAKMILKIYDEVSSDRSKKEAERLEQALFGRQNGRQISKSA